MIRAEVSIVEQSARAQVEVVDGTVEVAVTELYARAVEIDSSASPGARILVSPVPPSDTSALWLDTSAFE